MSDSPPGSFGSLLRRLRSAAGLTQEELADAAKVSYRSISDLERGVNRSPRRDTARLLAEALGLSGQDRVAFDAAARGPALSAHLRAVPRPESGATAAATRTLPRDIASFTGRKVEIDSLLEAVTHAGFPGSVVDICAIGGMAGIGKTTLAVHAAHRLAGSFPDGQLFLQLHGHTPGQNPVDPADALASLLQAIGIPGQHIPEGLEPRAWLWRDRLADKRLLLVLDDAAGHDQVRPLLPGAPGTLVLITSRHHLTALEDARVISLDTLPPADAAALLVRLAARPSLTPNDDSVREIVRLCGYLPLAIGMLARQLHHHPAWNASYLVAELDTARERLELMRAENLSITAAFDLSYRQLTHDEQRLFRYLGFHPGDDFDIYAAAALGKTDLATTRNHLSRLYDHYLLRESTLGRYEMHDLIGEYASSLAATEPIAVKDAAVDRLMCYYLHTARAACAQFNHRAHAYYTDTPFAPPEDYPAFSGRADAAAWVREERVNLGAATNHAVTQGHLEYAIEIPAAMHWCRRDSGYLHALITLHYKALAAAQQLGDQQAEANALTNIGETQQRLGELEEASSTLIQAIRLHGQHGNDQGVARALSALGYVQHLSGDRQAAEDSLADALERYEALSDEVCHADALVYMSKLHMAAGNYLAASADIRQALRVHPGMQGAVAGDVHPVLGLLQRGSARDHSAAMRTMILGFEWQRGADDPHSEVRELRRLAFIQQARGDSKAATASLDRALQLSREFGIEHDEARSLHYLGLIQYSNQDYQVAAISLREALEVYHGLGIRLGEAEVMNVLGQLAGIANQHDQARDYYQKALAIATEAASRREQARALEGIGHALIRQGKPDEAPVALRQALDIYERIGSSSVDRVQAALRDMERPAPTE